MIDLKDFEIINDLKNDEKFNRKTLKDKKEWISKKYKIILKDELYLLNREISENGISGELTKKSNDFLEILENIKDIINEKLFLELLIDCSLNDNESKIINNCLKRDGLNQSIVNIAISSLEKKTIEVLKNYRESIESRKDIKNNNNENLLDDVGILKPILTFLSSDIAPAIRMELLQKVELYFTSGWGFDDLTNNSINSSTVIKLQNALNELKENKNNDNYNNGKNFLNILSERMIELGVPMKVVNKQGLNSEKIPTIIIEDKEKNVYSTKKVTSSGFVDWVIPDFRNKDVLHISLATSDETCSIENSQLFRHGYAIKEFIKNNPKYKKANLSFFAVSNFYDKDENNKSEIGLEFLNRFNVKNEERKILNLLPFLSMSDTINSNYNTGMYSSNQLVDYNFCLVGAKSILENTKYEYSNVLYKALDTTLNILNNDNQNFTKFTDNKTLQIVSYLYHMLSSAQNDFFENKEIMDLLFEEKTINILKSIYKKLPDAIPKENLINKNNFQRLIDSIDLVDKNKFINRQLERKKEATTELNKLKSLEDLSQKIDKINDLNKKYNQAFNNKLIKDNWFSLSEEERVKEYKKVYIESVQALLETAYSQKNNLRKFLLKIINDVSINDSEYSNAIKINKLKKELTYFYQKTFNKFDENKDNFKFSMKIKDYSFLNKTKKPKENNLLLNFSYMLSKMNSLQEIINLDIPEVSMFENYSALGSKKPLYTVQENILALNNLKSLILNENIEAVLSYNKCIDDMKNKIIKNINENYSQEDILFIETKNDSNKKGIKVK